MNFIWGIAEPNRYFDFLNNSISELEHNEDLDVESVFRLCRLKEAFKNDLTEVVMVEKDKEILGFFMLKYENEIYVADLSKCPSSFIEEITYFLAEIENLVIRIKKSHIQHVNKAFVSINNHISNGREIVSFREPDYILLTNGPKDIVAKAFEKEYLEIPDGPLSVKVYTPSKTADILLKMSMENANGYLWRGVCLSKGEYRTEQTIPGFNIFQYSEVKTTTTPSYAEPAKYFLCFRENKICGVLKMHIEYLPTICVIEYAETIETYRNNGVLTALAKALNSETVNETVSEIRFSSMFTNNVDGEFAKKTILKYQKILVK